MKNGGKERRKGMETNDGRNYKQREEKLSNEKERRGRHAEEYNEMERVSKKRRA